MTDSEISEIVKNATVFLKKQYKTFQDCVWNEKERCFIYSFKSEMDAEQFRLWKFTQGNQFRLDKHIHHANLTVV